MSNDTTITCSRHPGGPAQLAPAEFYPSERNKRIGTCKACRLQHEKERATKRRAAQQGSAVIVAQKPTRPAVELMPEVAPTARACGRKIGGYYISENAILIADMMQEGKIVLHTTLLEIDGETKHPRNKRIIFTRHNAPEEYRSMSDWLCELSGGTLVDLQPGAEQTAALQLAEEATAKMIAAQKENDELKAALAPLRSLLNGGAE